MAVSKKTTDTVAPAVPPVDSAVPPVDSVVPPVDSVVPPVDSVVPPVDSAVPPVDSAVPPVDSAVPPVDSAVPPVDSAVNASGEETPTLTPEEIAANQAAADAAFKAANDGAEERIAKEESIPSMSADELQAEFGWTVPEAISVLRDALSRSGSIHLDKMNDLLDKIEQTASL